MPDCVKSICPFEYPIDDHNIITEGEYAGFQVAQCDSRRSNLIGVPGVSLSGAEMKCMLDQWEEWEMTQTHMVMDKYSPTPGRVCLRLEDLQVNDGLFQSLDRVAEECFQKDVERKREMLETTIGSRKEPTSWDHTVDALIVGVIGFGMPQVVSVGIGAGIAALIKRIFGKNGTELLVRNIRDLNHKIDDLERRLKDRGPDDPDDPPPAGGGGKVPAALDASETAAESSAAETAGFAALFVGALTILGTHGHKIVGGMRSIGTGLAVGIEGAAAMPFMFYDPQLMPPEYRQGGDEA